MIYPAFGHLTAALRGERLQFYDLTQGSAETLHFVRGQHAGSLRPATVLSRQVDLTHRRKLLDVAGGSGAFSIVLCKRFPNLRCTILDLPGVVPIARQFVDEAQLGHRINVLAGNAFEVEWPGDVDVVLISYLLSAVAGAAIPELLRRALAALIPGGQIILHDFMLDDDERGPTTAALWLMYGLLCDPDAVLLTPGRLSSELSKAGFGSIEVFDTIPTVTRTLAAKKP